MNVLRRELTGGARTVLVWILIVAGLNVLMIALFQSFAIDYPGDGGIHQALSARDCSRPSAWTA